MTFSFGSIRPSPPVPMEEEAKLYEEYRTRRLVLEAHEALTPLAEAHSDR